MSITCLLGFSILISLSKLGIFPHLRLPGFTHLLPFPPSQKGYREERFLLLRSFLRNRETSPFRTQQEEETFPSSPISIVSFIFCDYLLCVSSIRRNSKFLDRKFNFLIRLTKLNKDYTLTFRD